ncbi:glycerophosphodiester phosphodiesterase [Exiguobacterium sp. B2(2022)]|uniref:glycerophosphodiester phosphodiesterase n=1 Tax=Exiguobacterium sp. B2(2022) TaxID=2992755 RepID=UPI00237AE02D|nr:glycerophosphodiester phosphodiesterase [Exiguobacterium sp. B2(2022)]MDE0564833.1 glycerophosphodiester phosphodiesterase [Exiguobacterium sp. B2(2022)]
MLIYAHRGYSANYPENTLSAFEAALPYVDGIELDVQLSKDGRLVVIHDETVDRTTDGTGWVKDMTLQELRQLKIDGYERIPTLEEVLGLIERSDVTLNVELKTDQYAYPGIERLAWLTVDEFHMTGRVVFSSFNRETLVRMRDVAPHARLAVLTLTGEADTVSFAETIRAEAIHAQTEFIGSASWEEMRRTPLETRIYTINDVKDLPLMPVAAIMTDEVERFAK